MEANELRIGNYLEFTDTMVCAVTSIRSKNEFVVNDQWSSYATEVRPIPLTEKWLLKFGFEKHGEWYCIRGNNMLSINVSIKHNKTTVGENEEYEIDNMNFVHQLQNLYFALTGTELKTKNK